MEFRDNTEKTPLEGNDWMINVGRGEADTPFLCEGEASIQALLSRCMKLGSNIGHMVNVHEESSAPLI